MGRVGGRWRERQAVSVVVITFLDDLLIDNTRQLLQVQDRQHKDHNSSSQDAYPGSDLVVPLWKVTIVKGKRRNA